MDVNEHIRIINEQAELLHQEHGFIADRNNAYIQLKIAIADLQRAHEKRESDGQGKD